MQFTHISLYSQKIHSLKETRMIFKKNFFFLPWLTSNGLSFLLKSPLCLIASYALKTHPFLDVAAASAAKSLQSCPTLCDPIDGSPPGSSFPGILQARTLEWVTISFSNAWKWKVKVKSLSRVQLLGTSRTATYQASPSMGFSRQEYWSGVPLPSPFLDVTHWNIKQSSCYPCAPFV